MKPKFWAYLSSIPLTVIEVLILISPVKSQDNRLTESDENAESSNGYIMPVDSADRDFTVKYKGEILSLKKLLGLLSDYNISVPQNEDSFFNEVINKQTSSRIQSCNGRCFKDERTISKTCYCDKACITWGDCCLDFHLRCSPTRNISVVDGTCGDVNAISWSGVIMKSCSSAKSNQSNQTNQQACQTVQQLNMTFEQELPVFDWTNNITYRSIACGKCNNAKNLSFWGFEVTCSPGLQPPLHNTTALKTFVRKHDQCYWKYKPFPNRRQYHTFCVMQDSLCASSQVQLPIMSTIRELCFSYSMVFSFASGQNNLHYRNPHCALCNPEGRQLKKKEEQGGGGGEGEEQEQEQEQEQESDDIDSIDSVAPLTILFDVSSDILINEATIPSPTQDYNLISFAPNQTSFGYNTTWQEFYCDSNKNCTVTFGIAVILGYITLIGSVLSIVSLCFLLGVYMSFKELRNLPGKCLMSLSWALLFYQVIFLFTKMSKEVEGVCKAIAIGLHFFALAAFSWMSVMAFDTACTFTVQVSDTSRQPSDITKSFLKYSIVGWGIPAVLAVGCAVLDSTGIFHIGYGNSLYCWISNKTAILVAMVTPVSLTMAFNAVCLSKSIYSIYNLQQGAGLAAANSPRVSLVVISIKLTSVMGLTWILALITNWQQFAFLQFPSTILNSLQGFFIMVCFTTTKKVRGLIRNKLPKRRTRTERQTTMTRCSGGTNTEMASDSPIMKKGKIVMAWHK